MSIINREKYEIFDYSNKEYACRMIVSDYDILSRFNTTLQDINESILYDEDINKTFAIENLCEALTRMCNEDSPVVVEWFYNKLKKSIEAIDKILTNNLEDDKRFLDSLSHFNLPDSIEEEDDD